MSSAQSPVHMMGSEGWGQADRLCSVCKSDCVCDASILVFFAGQFG